MPSEQSEQIRRGDGAVGVDLGVVGQCDRLRFRQCKGSPVGTRTRNRLLRRQMLYPVELQDRLRTFPRCEVRNGSRSFEMVSILLMDSRVVITSSAALT